MRICWLTYGFGEYSVRQVAALAEDHDVLLAIPEDEYKPQIDLVKSLCPSNRLEVYPFKKPRLRHPFRQVLSVRKILQRIHAFSPDVVHYQQGHLWFNGALRWVKHYPLVVTVHDPRHHSGDAVSAKTPQWVIDYGFRSADHVIVHGDNLVSVVNNDLGISRERIHVVPHVAMGQNEAKPEVSFEEDNDLILFFGRIWDYKGLDYLIKAQPLINAVLPNVKIMIAGRGDDFARYRAMMKSPDAFIVHNEWISDEQRAEFFQRAAVVVLPYTDATQSGVVPVASTFAKPVVATNVGALPNCVLDGTTGLLVPPRNERALADAIVELLTDPQRRHEMGQAARAKLMSESSAPVVAAQTASVYDHAINDRNLSQQDPSLDGTAFRASSKTTSSQSV